MPTHWARRLTSYPINVASAPAGRRRRKAAYLPHVCHAPRVHPPTMHTAALPRRARAAFYATRRDHNLHRRAGRECVDPSDPGAYPIAFPREIVRSFRTATLFLREILGVSRGRVYNGMLRSLERVYFSIIGAHASRWPIGSDGWWGHVTMRLSPFRRPYDGLPPNVTRHDLAMMARLRIVAQRHATRALTRRTAAEMHRYKMGDTPDSEDFEVDTDLEDAMAAHPLRQPRPRRTPTFSGSLFSDESDVD